MIDSSWSDESKPPSMICRGSASFTIAMSRCGAGTDAIAYTLVRPNIHNSQNGVQRLGRVTLAVTPFRHHIDEGTHV
jgi:hypothetical protein